MTEPVPVDLKDGKPHALKFTARGIKAMRLACEGKSFADVAQTMGEDDGLAAFLLAGLIWQEPRMTYDDALLLVDDFRAACEGDFATIQRGFGELARAIGQALERSGHIAKMQPNGADPKEPPRMATAAKPST